MLTENYNEKAQYLYYSALIAIRAEREHDASAALNAARNALLSGGSFTELEDSHFQQIAEDLTENAFYTLYGDYGYNAKTIGKNEKIHWVPQSLRPMVNTHFTQFEEQFGDIVNKRMVLQDDQEVEIEDGVKSWNTYLAERPANNGPSISAGVA